MLGQIDVDIGRPITFTRSVVHISSLLTGNIDRFEVPCSNVSNKRACKISSAYFPTVYSPTYGDVFPIRTLEGTLGADRIELNTLLFCPSGNRGLVEGWHEGFRIEREPRNEQIFAHFTRRDRAFSKRKIDFAADKRLCSRKRLLEAFVTCEDGRLNEDRIIELIGGFQ